MTEDEARGLVVKLNQWAGYEAWSVHALPWAGKFGILCEPTGKLYQSIEDMPEDAQILGGLR